MHQAAFSYIAAHIPPGTESVLELGSRNINGTVRVLLPTARFIGVDIMDGDGVDIVQDAATLDLEERFDLVICAEVLEHAPDEQCVGMCSAAFKHLEPGGSFLVTAAGPERQPHSAMDGGPLQDGEFYRNVSEDDLRGWLADAGFASVETNVSGPDVRAKATK